jgi:hypothetical protein
MKPVLIRSTLSILPSLLLGFFAAPAVAAPTCPLSYGSTDAAKSHKLYLYFPTADDATYPFQGPAKTFDVADLTAGIGTTAQLRNRIHDIVVDDFCEFNVQVLQTTTNPDTLASPPARRHIEAIGSDNSGGGAWGLSPTSNVDVLRGRVWAGAYVACEGGAGDGVNCSMTGALTGANNTLDHWAQAIGGTSAHESGHTYGVVHSDDDPPMGGFDSACGEYGLGPAAGEDSLTRHLMPNGCRLDGHARTTYRRHFSDRAFGILATNIGLSVQTMHNWDFVNPNAGAARSLSIEFLSALASISASWTYSGPASPWINPTVASIGTGTWHGATLHKYRITWSTPNPAWGGPAGTVNGGAEFHVGATFTGVDFNAPDPIVIQNVTLFDAGSSALALHPRLPIYDAGTPDAPDGAFAVHFEAAAGAPLQLQQAVIYQLPRLASIDSMVRDGRPFTFDRLAIRPWTATKCAPGVLRERIRCVVANLNDRPHVIDVHKIGDPNVVDCSKGLPREVLRGPIEVEHRDSRGRPDIDGPICAATVRDPFPSATVYVIATFVDPAAKHWDPRAKKYVVGPVTTRLYYQFAGIRDLRRLGKGGLSPTRGR